MALLFEFRLNKPDSLRFSADAARLSADSARTIADSASTRAGAARTRADAARIRTESVWLRADAGQAIADSVRIRAEAESAWLRVDSADRPMEGNQEAALDVARPGLSAAIESTSYLHGRCEDPMKPETEKRSDRLTRRECEVLRCIADGHSTKQVAGILRIAVKTAACHRYRVMEKLGIHDLATLVRYAIRNNLVG